MSPIATPVLPLPFELRMKILSELLTSGETLGFYTKHDGSPIITDAVLANRFSTLCLVSRQMRTEAQKVFFEYNRWNLEISLVRRYQQAPLLENYDGTEEYEGTRNGNSSGGVRAGATCVKMNTACLIMEHWGEDSLLRMRDVILDVKGSDEEKHSDTETVLKEIVAILKKGGGLRRLELSWGNRYGLKGYRCGTGRRKAVMEIQRASRREDGTREEPGHRRIREWRHREVVLKPVLELRPVREVCVIGCVTDEWAEYLERWLRVEGDVPAFVRDGVASD